MEDSKNRLGLLRKIGFVVSAILIVISIICFTVSYFLAKPIHELEKSKPISIKADVSGIGVFSGTIVHSENEEYANFGIILYLKHDSDLTFSEICEELEGKIEILDNLQEVVNEIELNTGTHSYRLGTENIKGYPVDWIIYPLTANQETVKITVTKPVERLAGIEQVFEGYYLLNGMEYLPSLFAGCWGLIILGSGLIIALIIKFAPVLKKLICSKSKT